MTSMQVFEPEGRAVPYAAEGEGPALVLIADRGLAAEYLEPLAHSVSQEDFRVVRIGLREGAIDDLAQDVVDVMDLLDIDDAWVGGHGAGGSIARQLSLVHHARVNGVLLLGVEAPEAAPPLAEGVPVLVIQGTADDVTPPGNGDALRASAPGLVSVVPIEGGEHMFPATHVGATSWAIEDYLDWD
ncbi:MAG: alpha/beta hydrolase [Microbacterium sp.]|jgi:pimeloyl-ACP methyl ester carboxylesterase|uniref:alpha/beta fold hydrolase n=1 Tax=unclassified Microbacterium TaxID=2609290 RepID=UPI000DB4FC95|nr:alpha/beta fold hydrolase [Microbacterium sp.]PZU41481.1 MAG: alpha/beta hydrolase [Microbacterium sp.]